MMRTRELLHLHNTGHQGINALFSKAHSANWDIDRDVDWSTPIAADDPLVDPKWGAFSQTDTFQSLPVTVQHYLTRRSVGRMLNILQVGESVAQHVCAKLLLVLKEDDYRNHAAAQAMDEARHHLAYCRFIDKMDEEVEDIDIGVEMMFNSLLAAGDPLRLIATEQFFLESLAMDIFEGLQQHATHPLLRDILTLIIRDESRHMGFGVLYIAEWMQQHSIEDQISFAQSWLGEIFAMVMDQPGPIMLQRVVQRMRDAGVDNAETLGAQMLREQHVLNKKAAEEVLNGRRIPRLLTSARRAGLLKPEIIAAIGMEEHPLVQGMLRATAHETATAQAESI